MRLRSQSTKSINQLKAKTRRDQSENIRKAGYSFLQWTWGLPQTLLGAALYFANRQSDHFDYKGAKVTAWDRRDGVSLGKFVFVPRRASGKADKTVDKELLDHEYGHTLQSLMLGPMYLLLVGLPSFAWNRLPYFERKRKKTGRSYYSAVFEKTASQLGAKAANRNGSRR